MNLSAEQLLENWEQFLSNIKTYITEPRQQLLLDFYESNAERIITMPAAHTTKYHNCFPGGYVEHVNRVVECSIGQYKLWKAMGSDVETFTVEELIFAAINHDLGKLGDATTDLYVPSQDEWRKKNLGELYSYNTSIGFMTIPDRSLFLLQEAGIKYTLNEMLAIRTHDGLYDEANKGYLISRIPESRPKSVIIYILHQADLMASIIETQRTASTAPKSKNFVASTKPTGSPSAVTHQQKAKNKALSNVKSDGLKNVMDNFFSN
jgi:hypothetical protein